MSSRDVPSPRHLGNGIAVIPLPLPFPTPPWVNAYAISGDDGITLVDCGTDWDVGWRALVDGFDGLGLDSNAVCRLIVTHLHPDHVGMATRLRDRWHIPVVMHRRAGERYLRYNDHRGLQISIRHLAVRHGVPAERRDAFVDLGPRPSFMPEIAPPDALVDDGDRIPIEADRFLTVLHTPGHEQSHICLRDTRTGILFSGDHVLPRITPVIMIEEEGDDVLASYLRSLRRLIDLDVGLTYPAHGVMVERGSMRAEQIALHHDRRLARMAEVVTPGPRTAWTVMVETYRPHLQPLEQRLALRETVAHLEHLRAVDRIDVIDDERLRRYRAM